MAAPTLRMVSFTGPRLGPQVSQRKAQATRSGGMPQVARDQKITAAPRITESSRRQKR